MTEKLRFKEIEIPGRLLNDPRIRASVRVTYGKIRSLAPGNTLCCPDFRALDGTTSGNTARRHIRKLEAAGYLKIRGDGRGGKVIVLEPDGAKKW
jgi:hypothetical protein